MVPAQLLQVIRALIGPATWLEALLYSPQTTAVTQKQFREKHGGPAAFLCHALTDLLAHQHPRGPAERHTCDPPLLTSYRCVAGCCVARSPTSASARLHRIGGGAGQALSQISSDKFSVPLVDNFVDHFFATNSMGQVERSKALGRPPNR